MLRLSTTQPQVLMTLKIKAFEILVGKGVKRSNKFNGVIIIKINACLTLSLTSPGFYVSVVHVF